MKRRPRLGVIAACLFLVPALEAPARGPESADAPRFVAAPEIEGAPQLEGSTWIAEGPGHSIRLTMIDGPTRVEYIHKTIGIRIDPFASIRADAAGYRSFLIEVENRGSGELVFNPLKCWLQTNKKEVQTPMAMSDLSFAYRVIGRELPVAYEQIRKVLLDRTAMVAPGGYVHGLLVYRPTKEKTKSFHVDARLVLPNGEVVRFSAPYRRFKARNGRKS